MQARTSARAALIGLAAVIALLAVPSVSPAHNPWPSQFCPSGALCVWTEEDYNSTRNDLYGTNSTWSSGWSIFNNEESTANNGTSGLAVSVWTGYSYTGSRSSCVARGQANGHHNPLNSGQSNKWQNFC